MINRFLKPALPRQETSTMFNTMYTTFLQQTFVGTYYVPDFVVGTGIQQ